MNMHIHHKAQQYQEYWNRNPHPLTFNHFHQEKADKHQFLYQRNQIAISRSL